MMTREKVKELLPVLAVSANGASETETEKSG